MGRGRDKGCKGSAAQNVPMATGVKPDRDDKEQFPPNSPWASASIGLVNVCLGDLVKIEVERKRLQHFYETGD